jgi:S-adenosylmethionine:diacylglycerol 3-amino-3-carboxypropyl transferase
MFERFKSAKKLWNANSAAARVTSLLATSLFPVSTPGGGFDSRLKSDAFVVGYIYGVAMACEDAGEQEKKGYFILQVFEQLFPNQGKAVTKYCISQSLQKNPDFMRSTRVGFAEMIELVNSEGHKPLASLLSHVCEHYLDSGPASK